MYCEYRFFSQGKTLLTLKRKIKYLPELGNGLWLINHANPYNIAGNRGNDVVTRCTQFKTMVKKLTTARMFNILNEVSKISSSI